MEKGTSREVYHTTKYKFGFPSAKTEEFYPPGMLSLWRYTILG
jgi:hypothetical protein